MGEYRLTPAAKSIYSKYVTIHLKNGVKDKLRDIFLKQNKKLESLSSNPDMGRYRPEIKENYYSFPAEKHVIFYLISGEAILIIGILHCKMDIDKNLIY